MASLAGLPWGVTGWGGTENAISSVTGEDLASKPDENLPQGPPENGVTSIRRYYGAYTKTWKAQTKQVCVAWTNAAPAVNLRTAVSIPYVLEHLVNGMIMESVRGELTLEPGAERSAVVSLAADVQSGWMEEYVLRLSPIEIEVKHREPGTQNLPNTTLLRDEIVDLRIKVPPTNGQNREIELDVAPAGMRSQTLGTRGDTLMFDFGTIGADGTTITPLTADGTGHSNAGPYKVTLLGNAAGPTQNPPGEITLRAVFNKVADDPDAAEGKLKITIKGDGLPEVQSQELTIKNRIRKYARVPENGNVDYDKHDESFESAAKTWGTFYNNPVNPDVLKAIGFQETQLGYQSNEHIDIMTVGNTDDNILDYFHRTAPYNTMKEAIPDPNGMNGFTIRWLHYADANKDSVGQAIYWGTCWLYQKAQKGRHVSEPNNPPFGTKFAGWNSWETAVRFYGPNTSYQGVIEGPWKRGRHDSTTTRTGSIAIDPPIYIWPILSNHKARK